MDIPASRIQAAPIGLTPTIRTDERRRWPRYPARDTGVYLAWRTASGPSTPLHEGRGRLIDIGLGGAALVALPTSRDCPTELPGPGALAWVQLDGPGPTCMILADVVRVEFDDGP